MAKINENEVKEALYTSLKELGLSDLEIDLYTISLTLGSSQISTIAEHLQISRPNVYKVIKSLEKHGLAKFSEKTKYSRDFIVESPATVLKKVRNKKELISRLDNEIVSHLPDLLAAYHQGGKETKIKIIQGKDQYLKIFVQILEESQKEISFFGSAQDFIGFISWEEERNWIKRRIKKQIFMRSLILPGEDANTLKISDKDQMRETRMIKTQSPFNTSFHLFANKMIIWQPKVPLAVLIEDNNIISMFKSVFDSLWETSE